MDGLAIQKILLIFFEGANPGPCTPRDNLSCVATLVLFRIVPPLPRTCLPKHRAPGPRFFICLTLFFLVKSHYSVFRFPLDVFVVFDCTPILCVLSHANMVVLLRFRPACFSRVVPTSSQTRFPGPNFLISIFPLVYSVRACFPFPLRHLFLFPSFTSTGPSFLFQGRFLFFCLCSVPPPVLWGFCDHFCTNLFFFFLFLVSILSFDTLFFPSLLYSARWELLPPPRSFFFLIAPDSL